MDRELLNNELKNEFYANRNYVSLEKYVMSELLSPIQDYYNAVKLICENIDLIKNYNLLYIATYLNLEYETVDGETFLRNVKDVTILRPNTSHSIKTLNEKSCHYNIAVRKKYFESFIENKSVIKNYFEKNGFLSFSLDDDSYAYISSIIPKINNTKYDYLSLTIVECVLHVITTALLPVLINNYTSYDKITHYVKDAVQKINDGTLVAKSAKDVYSLYPLSHTTFINSFKELTGVTTFEYLLDKKLEYSKKLLLTTRLSVLDVSLAVGFQSVSHFIRIFKNKHGITPLQLRKTDANNKEPELVK